MSVQSCVTGFVKGTGAAVNVELGFIPDVVIVSHVTASVPKITVWNSGRMCAFTSGGTAEIKPGDLIQGDTATNVRARVKYVFVTSGTWAGGDAAGYLIWYAADENGTFGSENVSILDREGSHLQTGGGKFFANAATVAAQTELSNWALAHDTTTTIAKVTPANGIQPYKGSAGAASWGFTITATLSANNTIMHYTALRGMLTV